MSTASMPTSDAVLPSFRTSSYPILRVNLTPASSPMTGTHVDDAERLGRLAELTRAQAASSVDVSEILYRMAPLVDDDVRRRLVLPLRRCVHNARTPEADIELGALAHLAGVDQVRGWIVRQVQGDRLRADLVLAHAGRLDEEREALRAVLAGGPLGRSLAMSSTLLPAAAARYTAAPWEHLTRRGRKSEHHLLRYALRATAKTSPFSQYTAIAYPAPSDEHEPAPLAVASDVTLNLSYLRRVDAALSRDPAVAASRIVHLAPGLRLVDGRVVTAGQRDALGAEAAEIAERFGEAQVSVAASPVVLALLAWFGERGSAGATVAEVVATLVAQVRGVTPEIAASYVLHLRDSGVLRCVDLVDEQSGDALGDFRRRVEDLSLDCGVEALEPVCRGLRRLEDARARLGAADADERVHLLRSADEAAVELLRALGEGVADRPLPRPLWYEDARLTGPSPFGVESWGGALSEVAALLGVVQAFDEQHVFMRVLRHQFVQRFGVGGRTDDLDELASLFLPAYDTALRINEGFHDPILEDDPLLAGLVELRGRILADLTEQLAPVDGQAAPVDIDVDLAAGWSREVSDALPGWFASSPASYAVFMQPLSPDPQGGTVLNKIYNGWGNYVSRFLPHAPAGMTEEVRRAVAEHFPPTEIVAEFRPVNGYNANVHPLLTPDEIDVTGRSVPGRIALDRLEVQHNCSADRVELVDPQTGSRVNPLYLGFLIPYYLPSRLVPLTAMAGSGSVMFEPQVSVDRMRRSGGRTIRSYPRVTWGRTIIARRRWIVPADRVPVRAPQESDAAYFVRFNEWRLAVGMPDELFLHPPAPELQPGQVNEYFDSYLSHRKPQYVAATRRLHCRYLSSLLEQQPGTEVVFEEALPSPGAGSEIAGRRHTVELVVDFYRPAGAVGTAAGRCAT
jgi:hypothetical protein